MVPEDAARRLVSRLEHSDLVAASARALQEERVRGMDGYRMALAGESGVAEMMEGSGVPYRPRQAERVSGWLLSGPWRALVLADESYYLRQMEGVIERSRQPWRELQPGGGAHYEQRGAPWWATLSEISLSTIGRMTPKRDECIARRDLLRVALGLQVYRQRFGRFPDRLAELAEVQWTVPRDVFSGRDLVYRNSGASFLLYSVGQDLKDDEGRPMPGYPRPQGNVKRAEGSEPSRTDGDLVWMAWAHDR
jgi:hypothetical protein